MPNKYKDNSSTIPQCTWRHNCKTNRWWWQVQQNHTNQRHHSVSTLRTEILRVLVRKNERFDTFFAWSQLNKIKSSRWTWVRVTPIYLSNNPLPLLLVVRVCSKVSLSGSSSWWWAVVDTRRIANTPRSHEDSLTRIRKRSDIGAGTPHTTAWWWHSVPGEQMHHFNNTLTSSTF